MAGFTMYDTQTLQAVGQMNTANMPFLFNGNFNTLQNVGGSAFTADGKTLYSAFNSAPFTQPATRAQASTLLISDPRNLSISLGIKLPEHDPIHKATIIPRGQALGMVQPLPETDRLSWHKDEMEQKIAMAMAGKAAEIFKFGAEQVSGGAANDIMQASQIARTMVMRLGMSSKVGNVDYSEAHEGYRGNTGGFSISAKTKEAIEDEVKRIIDEGYELAFKTISDNALEFERVAQGLLEYETLTGEEIRKVMAGEKLGSGDDAGTPPAPSGGGSASVVAIPKTRKPRTTKPKPDPEPSPL